jgi:hypothetical protein
MNKKSDKTSPNTPASETRALVTTNYTQDPKKFVHEILYETYLGEQIPYVIHDEKKLYPVNGVGRILGYGGKHETQLFERNSRILKGYVIPLRVRGIRYATSVFCINSIGLLILTGRADIERLPKERQEIVIRIIQFMAESADMRLRGELLALPGKERKLIYPIVEDRLDTLLLLSKATGCDPACIIATELAIIEKETDQIIPMRHVLPLQNRVKKASIFTETELGTHFGVSGRKIMMILKDMKYLQTIGGRVDYTRIGLLYGEWRPGIEFKGKMRTMARMRRFWNQDIVPKLEEHFYYLQRSKEGLFTGEMGVIS